MQYTKTHPKTRIERIDYDKVSPSQALRYYCQKYALIVELKLLWGLIRYEVVVATTDSIEELNEIKV